MVWHYHDDDISGPDAAVSLKIPGLPLANGQAKLTHYRIDETHSNAFTLWKALGEPQRPSPAEYSQLEEAGKLAAIGPAATVAISKSTFSLNFKLPRQGVSLLVLEWD
jgi:xylan 1,4-beta-xylosidase